MKQDEDYVLRNTKTKGKKHFVGTLIRKMPYSHLVTQLPSDEPMVRISSGRNEAMIPQSLVKRLVDNAPDYAFGRSTDAVLLDGGYLADVLEDIECEDMPLRMRYAVIEAQCVAWAAVMFTFVGDVKLAADQELVEYAQSRGRATDFKHADFNMEMATMAARISKRPLSRAA